MSSSSDFASSSFAPFAASAAPGSAREATSASAIARPSPFVLFVIAFLL